ncbi:MAG: 4Fe-4S binding protein [Candidatus Korobacteraceae bacterium]|jgi:polyferredoxin
MATRGISTSDFVQVIKPVPQQVRSSVPKKKLVRRREEDRSQLVRRIVQFAFLALNLWVGIEFYAWVRFFESGGVTKYVERPAGVDGWLPIDALMNLKLALLTGSVPRVHPAGMFLLLAFLGVSLLFHKAFCSWLCPVGTLSEYLWKLGRKIQRRNFQLSRWLDIPLRGLKYLLLALFVWVIGRMSVEALAGFLSGPYGIIADVKIELLRHIGQTGAIVLAVLTLFSLVVQNFWCRYLCPYGALVGLAALFSPTRIRREPEPCIDCGKCAKACPAWLPVDRLVEIRSAECTACMECVAVCPAQGALQLSVLKGARYSPRPRLLGRKGTITPWAMAACVAAIFLGLVGYARISGHWQTRVPNAIYLRLVPNADAESHPGM